MYQLQAPQSRDTWPICPGLGCGAKVFPSSLLFVSFSSCKQYFVIVILGTSFDDFKEFQKRIDDAGVAAMEMVAMEMKSVLSIHELAISC